MTSFYPTGNPWNAVTPQPLHHQTVTSTGPVDGTGRTVHGGGGAAHTPTPRPTSPADPTTTPTSNRGPLSTGQQDALAYMQDLLKQWDLTSLGSDLRNLILKGDTNTSTLSLALQQTDAYKQRFAGNEIRKANGLAVLSPGEYLAAERSYRQVLQAYGLPSGFYDQHSDFADFIGGDVSATELESRAKIAHDQYLAAPDDVKNLWSQYFGNKGDALAAILDPKVATQVIQDRGLQVQIGGAAAHNGLSVDQARAQQLQQGGVTADQAASGYKSIGQSLGTDQLIGQRFGTTFTQADEENDVLLNQADAAKKRALLYQQEQGLFKGGNSATSDSLGVSQSNR